MMFNYLSVVLGVFYFAMGIFVIWNHFFIIGLEPVVSYIFGGILILYGILRAYRGVNKIRNEN